MSGVLHPVGPEPERTYWLRRGLVLGAVLLLGIAAVLFVRGGGPESAVATPPSPSLSPALPQPGGTLWGVSSSVGPSDAGSPTPKPVSKPGKAARSAPTSKTRPVTCSAARLRATLTGNQRLKPEQKTTFELSLINGSRSACVVRVSPANFRLTISSGSDRIWSSDDCAGAVEPIRERVAAEDAVAWTMDWNGHRSAPSCQERPEAPRAGTYVATARLEGADPVQLRMILRD